VIEPAKVEARVEKLKELLFASEYESVYAVLDGASISGLLERLQTAKEEWTCLYRGELEPDLAEVAPYLVKLRRESPLTAWILSEGWGNHWGIFAVTPVGLEAMRRHLRRFLRVKDPDDQVLYFRFYDPRVLRLYLPTCLRSELAKVCGPVSKFITEPEVEPGALVFPYDPIRIKPELHKLS
jgi:hypothetical protein